MPKDKKGSSLIAQNKKAYHEIDYVVVDKGSDEYRIIEMYRSFDKEKKNRFLQYAEILKNEE